MRNTLIQTKRILILPTDSLTGSGPKGRFPSSRRKSRRLGTFHLPITSGFANSRAQAGPYMSNKTEPELHICSGWLGGGGGGSRGDVGVHVPAHDRLAPEAAGGHGGRVRTPARD